MDIPSNGALSSAPEMILYRSLSKRRKGSFFVVLGIAVTAALILGIFAIVSRGSPVPVPVGSVGRLPVGRRLSFQQAGATRPYQYQYSQDLRGKAYRRTAVIDPKPQLDLRRRVVSFAEETSTLEKPRTTLEITTETPPEGPNNGDPDGEASIPAEVSDQSTSTSSSSSSTQSSTQSSTGNTKGLDTISALDGMLGGDADTQLQSLQQKPKEPQSEAQQALDMLSGWFGPDEAEIEKEKEAERRKQEAERRRELEEANKNGETVMGTDEKMPEDVMKVLGLARNASSEAPTFKDEAKQSLLDDLKQNPDTNKDLIEAVTNFWKTAERMEGENSTDSEQLREDFANILEKLQGPSQVDMGDMMVIMKSALGPKTFYVTSSDPAEKYDGVFGLPDRGYVFCGNFRGDQDKIFTEIQDKVKEMFKGKYEVFLIPDPEIELDPFADDQGYPKAALQVIPADRAQPEEEKPWRVFAAVALFGITSFYALELGLAASSIQIPPEVAKFLEDPANFNNPELVPPGWDPYVFLSSVGQITGGALAVQILHEIGHKISASLRNVKLGTPWLNPLGQLPTSFGAITRFTSTLKNNQDLFDIAAAGPLSGVILASILFAAGLSLTGTTPPNELVSVPYPFLEKSLLLGSIAKAALGIGDGALVSDAVLVHPLVVAGWVGLMSQAFNSLPVGGIDGGRMVQASFGSGPLGFTSLLTYVALGFGVIGGSTDGLLFGLYLLFFQRTGEKYIQDTVTLGDDNTRRAISLGLVIFATMVLTPLSG